MNSPLFTRFETGQNVTITNFIQCSTDTSKVLFASSINVPRSPVINVSPAFKYYGFPDGITFLTNDRIMFPGPGICRIGGTYNSSLRLDRWPALFNWLDNAPCYWCKTFTANPSEVDPFARVSFSDSANGFVIDMDNGRPVSSTYYSMQPVIYSTTDGGETFQNGTLFPDNSLVLNPSQLICSPKPGLCFFLTDAGKLIKTNNYGQDWWVMTIIDQNIRQYEQGALSPYHVIRIEAMDEDHFWLSLKDTLYTTTSGGGTGWQPFTNFRRVNNVRLYIPGRITLPPLSGIEATISNTGNKIHAWYNAQTSELSLQQELVHSAMPIAIHITDMAGSKIAGFNLQATTEVQTFNLPLATGMYVVGSREGITKLSVWE